MHAPTLAVVMLLVTVMADPSPHRGKPSVDFTRDVRPILSGHCFACHGPDAEAREAELDLSERESALFVIEPGGREDSELWHRIRDVDDPMPPAEAHNALSAEQIEILGQWIDEGASYAPHWAYVLPRERVAPPADGAGGDASDPLDRMLRARQAEVGLTPSADAPREKLLRRTHFDLIGLPPTLGELDAFLADSSKDALSRVVDQLLARPEFGERFATFWFDLVRYADTVGYHGDQTHNVWPYRDWVVRALNDNLPFDRFSTLHLAGDLLPGPTRDDLVATTYNRLIQTTHEGGAQLKEYRAIYMRDRVRNVSEVWLGGTLGCAECHDHKYDPYTAKDFYAFGAFFADIDEEHHLREQYSGLNSLPTRRLPELELASDQQLRARDDARRHYDEAKRAYDAAKKADEGADLAGLKTEYENRRRTLRRADSAIPRTLYTKALEQPRVVRVLPRGNWLDESGPVVQPAVPAFLGEIHTEEGQTATRLDLARFLFAPDSEGGIAELTARVLVNRVWSLFFGRGLCPSVEDFGGQGRPPTHPDVLDQLALDFIESGWDLKALVRRLVLLNAYRYSSSPADGADQKDPENLYFARQTDTRLPAEMIRDAALSHAGLLVRQQGGPPVQPPQPAGHYAHLNFPTRKYRAHDDARQWRRSVYMHWQRQFLHPTMAAFDAPSRDACTAQRNASSTPTQSLVLLNDPIFVEAARAFAAQTLLRPREDSTRIHSAFRRVTSREPSDAEQEILAALLTRARAHFDNDSNATSAFLSIGNAPSPAGIAPSELAAWSQVTRALLNLRESITRD